MAKFNGMPDSANDMTKQLQKMRKQMEEQVKVFKSKELEVAAGGGVVRVTVIGDRGVNKITLDRDAVDPDNVEILEGLVKAAVNEALHTAEAENQQIVSKLVGGLPF